jgi:hypothetical protein
MFSTVILYYPFLAHLAQSAGELLGWPTKWRPSSVVRPHFKYSKDIFYDTARPMLMKLGRNTLCMKLYQDCSKNSISCRTLVAMATERKIFKYLLLKNRKS